MDIVLKPIKTKYDKKLWKISRSTDQTKSGAPILEVRFRKDGWGHDAFLRKALSSWQFGEERYYAVKEVSGDKFLLFTADKNKHWLCFAYLVEVDRPGQIPEDKITPIGSDKTIGAELKASGFLGDYLVINGDDTSTNLCIFSTKNRKDFIDELRRELEYVKLTHSFGYSEYTYELCQLENGDGAVIVSGPFPADNKEFNPPSWRTNRNTTATIFDLETMQPISMIYNRKGRISTTGDLTEFAKICGEDRRQFPREEITPSSHSNLQIDKLISVASLRAEGRLL